MRKHPRIVALVLAAGCSSRMRAFKPLAPLGGSTLIEEAVARFLDAGIADVRVVVGHNAGELIPVLERLGVRWILNAEYDRGMFSSVLAGAKSLEADVDAFFLLPADVPLVRPETIRALTAAFDPDDPGVIYPRFDGRRGHPPLIPAALLRGPLPEPEPAQGLRGLLGLHEENAVDMDVVDENILLDCDTPSDYQMLVERRSNAGIPSEQECSAIWARLGVSEGIKAHSTLVAELARVLAMRLKTSGLSLSIPLTVAAGLLHDIARGQPDHAGAGAKILAEIGHPHVGEIVAKHMDIRPADAAVNEAELIYFADKCVEEDRLVSPEERFTRSLARYADRPEIRKNILARLDNARKIAEKIGALIGQPVEDFIRRHGKR